MFRVFPNKGVQITFANGLTCSIMFGVGNYCQHRYMPGRPWCDDAEVAILRMGEGGEEDVMVDGVWGNTVNKSPEYVAGLLSIVAGFPADIDNQAARAAIKDWESKIVP